MPGKKYKIRIVIFQVGDPIVKIAFQYEGIVSNAVSSSELEQLQLSLSLTGGEPDPKLIFDTYAVGNVAENQYVTLVKDLKNGVAIPNQLQGELELSTNVSEDSFDVYSDDYTMHQSDENPNIWIIEAPKVLPGSSVEETEKAILQVDDNSSNGNLLAGIRSDNLKLIPIINSLKPKNFEWQLSAVDESYTITSVIDGLYLQGSTDDLTVSLASASEMSNQQWYFEDASNEENIKYYIYLLDSQQTKYYLTKQINQQAPFNTVVLSTEPSTPLILRKA